jgi:hypothetical protein
MTVTNDSRPLRGAVRVGSGRRMMDITSIYTPREACRCGAHSQHAVYRFLFDNPGASLKLVAKELGMTYLAVRLAKHRLIRRPDISRLCPQCFSPSFFNLACSRCGFEGDRPLLPEGVRFELTSPVHMIQPGAGLGSSTDYRGLHLQYGARNVQHLAERPQDPLLERCRSLLWEELKSAMLSDGVTEEASRLLVRHVSEFRARFPSLLRAQGLASQLVENVMELLRLRYPNRFGVSASAVLSSGMPSEPEPPRKPVWPLPDDGPYPEEIPSE